MAPVSARGKTVLLAGACVALVVAAVVRASLPRDDEEPDGGNGASSGDWVRTQPPGWDLVIYVPRAWADGAKAIEDGAEIHFGGPGEGIRRPELIFGWKASPLTLMEWWDLRIPKPEDRRRGLEVLEQGETRVAGMPTRWCVVRSEAKLEDGTRTRRLELDYWFGARGRIGHVRGIAPEDAFRELRPLFEEAAARVRYAR